MRCCSGPRRLAYPRVARLCARVRSLLYARAGTGQPGRDGMTVAHGCVISKRPAGSRYAGSGSRGGHDLDRGRWSYAAQRRLVGQPGRVVLPPPVSRKPDDRR
jgi:hypothetical protein